MDTSNTLDHFFQIVQGYLNGLLQGHDVFLSAQSIIRKEQQIGPGQCLRLMQHIRSAGAPLRSLSELLAIPEHLPFFVRSHRYALLIVLEHAHTLLDEVLNSMNELLSIARMSTAQQSSEHRRRQIVEQLDALMQCNDEIMHEVDRLRLESGSVQETSDSTPTKTAHQDESRILCLDQYHQKRTDHCP